MEKDSTPNINIVGNTARIGYIKMRSVKQFVLQEMDDEWIDKISKYLDPEELPFDNLFHGKFRIVIPYTPKELEEIKKDIEALSNQDSRQDIAGKHKGKEYTVDVEAGQVNITGVTGQGKEFTRKQSLGSFLQQTKDLPEGYKDWWNRSGGAFSIVVSRNPIDVLRMSDFEHIQSCHSQGGSYFNAGQNFQVACFRGG